MSAPLAAAVELKALLLAPPPLSLAAAESLTCGRVQARVGEVSGASGYFRGGITAYTLEQKVRLLGVDRAAARRVNCVSADVARQMAAGAARLFRSDLAVATTGYAERSPLEGVEAPFAWWALARRRGGRILHLRSGRIECPGSPRIEVQEVVAAAVLAELVAYLREIRGVG